MIKVASDAEEAGQRFDVVFRDISESANLIAANFGREFGVARDESKKLIGTTGDLLTGFGFTQEQALGLSNQVARLGADLASLMNEAAILAARHNKKKISQEDLLQSIEKVMNAGAQGVKIAMAGRLNGVEIARREKIAAGKVPLITLRSDVDYAFVEAQTIYGKIGIKVWIYRGEIFSAEGGSASGGYDKFNN